MRTTYAIAALLLGATSGQAWAQEASPDPATPPGSQGSITPPPTPAVDTPPAAGWALHGFADVSVKNDYVTPRGLVVTTSGATIQFLNGLVAVSPGGIALTAGTWTDFNPGYSRRDGNITAVNEFDFFVGVSGTIADKWKVGVQYIQFISGQPSVAFQDERNIEFSVAYDDSAPDKTFSINPYAKLFWAFDSKSSTVVTGKAGDTFDVELGVVPTLKVDAVTLSAPTWFTVGPKTYWAAKNSPIPGVDGDGNLGVASTGLKLSLPVSFNGGGAKASIYGQVQYYHLINDNLRIAKALLNSGDNDRDHVVFGVGVNVGL